MRNPKALKAAVERFLGELQAAEGMALKPGSGVSVEVEAEGEPGECPMCAAGSCTEHMAEEDMAGLAEAYGG